jgi:hypothetical protein
MGFSTSSTFNPSGEPYLVQRTAFTVNIPSGSLVSGNPEGIMFKSLWSEIQDVVSIKIQYQSDQNDHAEGDESCTVCHQREEGDQKDPENSVIYKSNDGKRVGVSLFDYLGIASFFFELCEPQRSMVFDANSIHHANQGKPDQTSSRSPKRSQECKQYINQCGYSQYQGEYIIPAYSKKFFFCHLVCLLFLLIFSS